MADEARSLHPVRRTQETAERRYKRFNKMSKKTYHYIIDANAGTFEKQRLALQQKIFGPGTEKFLTPFLTTGITALVVGCGTGEETCFIANAIAPTGKVVAIDINEKQLNEARNTLAERNITNVEFYQMDLMDLSELPYLFDLAVSRLTLGHIPDPVAALKSILGKLKPNGRIACEEAVISTAYSIPANAAFNKHIELLINYGRAIGADFDLGIKLKEIFMNIGLNQITEQLSQPIMTTAEEKKIIPLSAAACCIGYVAQDLITEKEAENLIAALDKEVANNPDCIVGQVEIHQVTGVLA